MNKFKMGDKVFIREDCEYNYQIKATEGTEGTITEVGDYIDYEVRFENGYFNYYTDKHLKKSNKDLSWKQIMEDEQ